MKKYILAITLCLASTHIHAKKGIMWNISRTIAAGYITYHVHDKISDKFADKIIDKIGAKYLMWKHPQLSQKEADNCMNELEVKFKRITGIEHEKVTKGVLALLTFNISKAVLDDYVYESIVA